jgi:mono/diheme cytochrome c family protein
LRSLLPMIALSACALSACLEDVPAPAAGQWPLTRAEIAAAAQKSSAAPTDPGEVAFRKTCIACHGADGRGNGGKTAADFTLPSGVLKKPDAVLLVSIRDGATGPIGVMPPHRALLKDDELAAVLAYVRRSFGPSITPEPATANALDAGSAAPTAP